MNKNEIRKKLVEFHTIYRCQLKPKIEHLKSLKYQNEDDPESSALEEIEVVVIQAVKKWQYQIQEYLTIVFGPQDIHTTRFSDTILKVGTLENSILRDLRRTSADSATYIESLVQYLDLIQINTKINNNHMGNIRVPKLFISHSSKDRDFVNDLVSLLEFMGFNRSNLFCSSIDGYGIPLGKNIFTYLREQFIEYDLVVIFIHSPRYYESAVSLNEMGAAWALHNEYFSVLTKDMAFGEMKGVVSSQDIAIKVDSEDITLRLNEFKDSLIDKFHLNPINESRWEAKRNEFIKSVTE